MAVPFAWLAGTFIAPLALFVGKGVRDLARRLRLPLARSLVLDCIEDMVIVMDERGYILDINRAAAQACGLTWPVSKVEMDALPAEWVAALRAWEGLEPCKQEVNVASRIYEMTICPLREPDGKMLGRMALFHDVTDRQRDEARLRQLSRAVEQSPATIVITDIKGKIEYVNPKFTQLTGYTYEEALGNNPRVLKSDLNPPEIYPALWQTILNGNEWRGEFINRKKNGELYSEAAIISPIIDSRGVITHFLAVKEDITQRKRSEEQMRYLNEMLQKQLTEIQALQAILQEQVIRDPLTGLYNRRYLYITLERELLRAAREGYPVGFVMIDIDHFKRVNDQYGHAAGDLVLRVLAEEMIKNTRASDIVCRYGGEEFLIVMFNAALSGVVSYAEKLCQALREREIEFGEVHFQVTLSAGIADYPLHGETSELVLSAADKALYRAKNEGRDRVVVASG